MPCLEQSAPHAGEQKSGTTWLWEMLNGHPCLLTAAQPHRRMGAITTKETYYFTSTKIGPDAREFLVPWMGYRDAAFAQSDAAWRAIEGGNFLAKALAAADRGAPAADSAEYHGERTFTGPMKKLAMGRCERYYLLEGARLGA
jgi:hypothetical protein